MIGNGSTDAPFADGRSDWEGLARSAALSRSGRDEADRVEVLRELLVFGVDGGAYAIPVDRTREIVRMKELTRLPRCPDWLLGVVALRGEVVEVVDLRRRLGLGASHPGRASRIIVLHGDGDRVAGILVDAVDEVYRVSEDEILPAEGLEVEAVAEMCLREGEFVSILDIDRALGDGGV